MLIFLLTNDEAALAAPFIASLKLFIKTEKSLEKSRGFFISAKSIISLIADFICAH